LLFGYGVMVCAETVKRWIGVVLVIAAVLATTLAWSGRSLLEFVAVIR
jgi:hypothetical protein